VLDYTKKGFADDGKKYDIILDAVGKRTFISFLRSLTETGVYITENGYVGIRLRTFSREVTYSAWDPKQLPKTGSPTLNLCTFLPPLQSYPQRLCPVCDFWVL
jgi:hypothetical protein